jgi:coenzyme F420 biosynthesis associated uncharacterized protein
MEWDDVRRLAIARVGPEEDLGPRRQALESQYRRLAKEVTPAFLQVVGGMHGREMPPFEALGRHQWIDVNIRILARVMEPVIERAQLPNNRLMDVGRAALDRYAAVLLAFLARRVLGQFDPVLLGREPVEPSVPALYLVEPNIESWEREAELSGEDLRRWLILHEMTHAWQFAAHPWLQEHMNGLIRELVATVTPGGSPASRLMAMTFGVPAQFAIARRMQATMTVVEGYGNLVMKLVGRQLLPDFERLERAYEERSARRSPVDQLFLWVTGLELKLLQYRRGERFCRAVLDAHGMDGLNLVWTGAAYLPGREELEDPEGWYRRVSRLAA